MRNFTNGALVFKIWRFDGDGEVLAKFQYMSHAKMFAEQFANGADRSDDWFILAVCEAECEVKSYLPQPMKADK